MELEFETRTTDYLRQSIEGVCRQEQTLEVIVPDASPDGGTAGPRCYTRSRMLPFVESLVRQITLTTVLDIAITAIFIYWLFSLIRTTWGDELKKQRRRGEQDQRSRRASAGRTQGASRSSSPSAFPRNLGNAKWNFAAR